jgi:hypothetical protein
MSGDRAQRMVEGIKGLMKISKLTPPPWRVCRNEGNAMLVILNPSPVILNEVKNLCHVLRVNSVKNLIESIS